MPTGHQQLPICNIVVAQQLSQLKSKIRKEYKIAFIAIFKVIFHRELWPFWGEKTLNFGEIRNFISQRELATFSRSRHWDETIQDMKNEASYFGPSSNSIWWVHFEICHYQNEKYIQINWLCSKLFAPVWKLFYLKSLQATIISISIHQIAST